MAGLEAVLERIEAVNIVGTVWLDGSFTTQKPEPNDVDFILITRASYRTEGTQEQADCIEWLINKQQDTKQSFRCDTDVALEFPLNSPFHQLGEEVKRHYADTVYGHSVTSREPKGIVVLSIPEAKPLSGPGFGKEAGH